MATFITLITFTETGAKAFKDTAKRAAAFKAAAAKLGVNVLHQFWTMGAYDGVLIYEAPDTATATAAMLMVGSQDYIQTETLPAFTADQMAAIVAKLPKK